MTLFAANQDQAEIEARARQIYEADRASRRPDRPAWDTLDQANPQHVALRNQAIACANTALRAEQTGQE